MRTITFILLLTTVLFSQAIIIDHTCTDITRLPQSAIENAKQQLHIAYGHTSHGSQITDGMRGLVDFANNGGKGLALPNDIFAFNNGGTNGALDYEEGDGYGDGWLDHDVGYYPAWVNETREYLNDPSHADVNVIMWSWCGQASGYSEEQMNSRYLFEMNQLEAEYPNVTFVYMTGHADGSGIEGNLHQRNQQIRQYCEQNGKVLFDFYDIECYDPDCNYYGDQYVDDGCNYSGGNWATEWQNSHTQGVDWYNCGSAHSQPLNANQKAFAVWWMYARLAGWAGPVQDTTPPSVPQNVSAEAVDFTQIDLSWDAATDEESGVSFYRIYRDEELLATTGSTIYSDQTCQDNSTYSYEISAVNGAGLDSDKSTPAEATTPSNTDETPPTIPTNLRGNATSSSEIHLEWNASTDNLGVTGYLIYRGDALIGQTDQTFYDDEGLPASTPFTYAISAFDDNGNHSLLSEPVTITTLDHSQEPVIIKLQNEQDVDDSFIFANNPNANYGSEGYVGTIDRFLLKFNLPASVMGRQIISAKLGLYVWNQSNYQDEQYMNIYPLTTPWEEQTVTWLNADYSTTWTNPGGDADMSFPIAKIKHQQGAENWDHTFYPEANITGIVQEWANGDRENYGLLITNDGPTGIGLKASEYSNSSRPYLEITYTIKQTHVSHEQNPTSIELFQNYPNPFNPKTTINFSLNKNEYTRLFIFDVTGKLVETLVDQQLDSGEHTITFNSKSLPSGVYYATLETASEKKSLKMLLLK